MAERKWSSPQMFLSLSGDKTKARRLVRKARICVGYLFDQLRPGQTYRANNWRLNDKSIIKVMVWRDILGERAVVKIFAPQSSSQRQFDEAIIAFIPASGDSIYSGFGPRPFSIETGAYFENLRSTFAGPYVDGFGQKINGLLGTDYTTVIYGVEGDHRWQKPNECGWLVSRNPGEEQYIATRNHSGYFGVQNWFGADSRLTKKMDVLSWDGPHSRYSFQGYYPIPIRGDNLFHRLKVLVKLSDYDLIYYRQIMGAGIEHTESGDVLRIIAAYPNLEAKIIAYEIGLTIVDGEVDDYFAKYYAVTGGLTTLDTIDLSSEFIEGGSSYGWTIRSGFYFNASGTKAVCTIGTSDGSDKTYLYHFDSVTGFSRELVFDATAHTIGDGSFPITPGADGGAEVDPQLAVVQLWDGINNYYVAETLSPSASESWTGTVRLLSQKQIVCADYDGDSLVYLYYTSPITEHTRTYSHQWSAHFWNWLDANGYPSTINVSGMMDSHTAQTNHVIVTGERTYESSDGKINWSGGATTSSQIVEGTVEDEGNTLSPDLYIPPLEDVVTDPTHPTMNRYIKVVWNGWIYDNPTPCVGEKKDYTINFVDLRSGVLCLVEDSLQEDATVYWLKSRDELEQTYHEATAKTFIVVDGRTVDLTYAFEQEERDVAIGLDNWYGIEYWSHFEDTFFIGSASNPIDLYGLHHAQVNFRGFVQKDGYQGTLLALRDDGILIYTLPLGWDGTGNVVQHTNWAGERNPQERFFEGDVNTHYITNLAFV